MTSYVLTYRSVKGSDLVASEVDANFHNLDDRITVLEEGVEELVGLDPDEPFTVLGDQFYANLTGVGTDGQRGPYTLPGAEWNPRGTWAPSTSYLVRDVFQIGGKLYKVLFNHTSDVSFDPGANDGMGHDYYIEVFSFAVIPTEIHTTTDDEISTITAFANGYVRCNSPTGTVITILDDDVANHPVGTEIEFRLGISGVTLSFDYETGVTVNYPDEEFDLVVSTKGGAVAIKKVAANEWDAVGLLDRLSS